MIGFHARRDLQLPADARVFLGDSHVEGLCHSCLPGVENFGIGGETTSDLLGRAERLTSLQSPQSCLLIEVGFNDLRADIATGPQLAALLKQVRSDRIVHFDIMPVSPALASRYAEDIAMRNAGAAAICAADKRCVHVPFSAFLPADAALYEPDGIHLNASGYRIWVAYLRRSIPALCGYGDQDVPMLSRVKELEEENRRLKKMYAEVQMSADILKEALAKKW
jgi:lysophospholipase L1-like esterase